MNLYPIIRSNSASDIVTVLTSLFTKVENLRVTSQVESSVNLQQSLDFPEALAKRVSTIHADGSEKEVVGAIEEKCNAETGGTGLQVVRPK